MDEVRMPEGGTWYVACYFPTLHMIGGIETHDDATAIADIHRKRHPESAVKVLWSPEPF